MAPDNNASSARSRRREACLWLLGIAVFVVVAITLDDEFRIPTDTTLRVACAAGCLIFIYQLGGDFVGERWPRIGFCVALIVNVGIFFTPLIDRPASRGEFMVFALPDAVVVLIALLVERIVSCPAADVRERAVRQNIILGLVVAIAFCSLLFALALIEPDKHQESPLRPAPAPAGGQ